MRLVSQLVTTISKSLFLHDGGGTKKRRQVFRRCLVTRNVTLAYLTHTVVAQATNHFSPSSCVLSRRPIFLQLQLYTNPADSRSLHQAFVGHPLLLWPCDVHCRVEMCMGMGFQIGPGIPQESHGNGTKTQNWEWEWEGMGNHLSGNGNYLHSHGNLSPKVLCCDELIKLLVLCLPDANA